MCITIHEHSWLPVGLGGHNVEKQGKNGHFSYMGFMTIHDDSWLFMGFCLLRLRFTFSFVFVPVMGPLRSKSFRQGCGVDFGGEWPRGGERGKMWEGIGEADGGR